MKRRSIFNCCTGDTGVADADDPADDEDDRVSEQSGAKRLHAPEAQRLTETEGESRVSRVQKTAAGGQGNSFMRLAPDNPWLVCRSADHGGRLFWMHERTHETTWRQPLPRLGMLPLWGTIEPTMYERCFAVTDPTFFGAPADLSNPKARTGICGVSPNPVTLQRTCETLSPEHSLYPSRFLDGFGLRRYVMCEELRYNGQRRRDVPDLASGTLYIDVGDRANRRKRHSFHHELWHMVDFHLLGNAFEAHDAEWAKHNPPGFKYGHGGKNMRSDSSSSQLSSAPHEEFLNRYSTSSIAEDKAEIWACLMCYQQVLKSPALLAKAELLKRRARAICPELNSAWWARVVESQKKLVDHWEVHYVDSQRGRAFWCNWVTEERRSTKPAETSALA